MRFSFLLPFVAIACSATAPAARVSAPLPVLDSTSCGESADVALQVLGSGGPIADDDRASSGYVVWVGGKSRLLVDAGGGVFLRFGQSGASLEELDAIALTHLHVDHSGDLPALLKSGYFATRDRPLALVGPSGNDAFPPIDAFVNGLLTGPFRYLNGYLLGSRGWFPLPVTRVDDRKREPQRVALQSQVKLTAVGVGHGGIPALGYRVDVRGHSIGFGGDQNAQNPAFLEMVRGVDALVLHHPIPESARNLRHLHAVPSELGTMAATANPRVLVLSHHMQRSLADLDNSLEQIQAHFDGEVIVADDLSCIPLGGTSR